MRRQCRLAWWRKFHAPRLNRPRLGIIITEVNRRQTNDLFILHINKDRSTICHIDGALGTVGGFTAPNPTDALGHHRGLGKPVGETVIAIHFEFEILQRIDLIEPVNWR